jgi:hypothetical protein
LAAIFRHRFANFDLFFIPFSCIADGNGSEISACGVESEVEVEDAESDEDDD